MRNRIPIKDRLFGLNPLTAKTIHLMGVGGTGMGALAHLLKTRGYDITGSDEAVYPPMSGFLKEWGIVARDGFRASNLNPRPDLAIVGNVVARHHEEAKALLERKIPFLSFPEAVREFFLREKLPIAVCGTHGKTTTTGLMAWTLRSAEKDPGFFVGGILKGLNMNSHDGRGDYFVIEGDEYDTAFFDPRPKFVHYRPRIAIVNGIEFDHADLYKDMDHLKSAFSLLKGVMTRGGRIIVNGDDPLCEEIYGGPDQLLTFGFKERDHWSARDLAPRPDGISFALLHHGKKEADIFLPMWGRHNVMNSLAVFAAGSEAGLSVSEIQNGVASFPGMKRRQEIFYSKDGVRMIDDFAHHPTAARETVSAVRAHNPDARLLAIFEPRSNTSRSDIFQKEYERAFDRADEVILYEPIKKNSRLLIDRPFLDMEALRSKVNEKVPCLLASDREGLFDAAAESINARKQGEKITVLIMSNGKLEGIYEELPRKINR